MYLTSFIHRNELFDIADRWFRFCPDGDDCQSLKKILIADGYVIDETLSSLAKRLFRLNGFRPSRYQYIRSKGELRDIICRDSRKASPRVGELMNRYHGNPDYYYREAPINAVACLDDDNHLVGSYRIKRPKRIAEKANRRIAEWIYEKVVEVAKGMARKRAELVGVPLNGFITPEEEMIEEFIRAEETVAASFREGRLRFDKAASVIHDVGAFKIIDEDKKLIELEKAIKGSKDISIVEREEFTGKYRAVNLILEVAWDREKICRQYKADCAWRRFLNRGISEQQLTMGLESLIDGAEPKINVELILTTFPDMVESEFGNSLHEERIIAQRDNKKYRGYIPINVEFLVESLFAVGLSPKVDIKIPPIKLWGRYLPETLGSYIRQLYDLPEHDLTH